VDMNGGGDYRRGWISLCNNRLSVHIVWLAFLRLYEGTGGWAGIV
jgi:hypothetical protein